VNREELATSNRDAKAKANRIALQEPRETRHWLQLCQRADLVAAPAELDPLLAACGELIAILTASARTAKQRIDQRN